MSTGSLITVENGQTLSDLFHKFIRMTVKTDDRETKFRKRNSISRNQQQQTYVPPSSKRSQRVIVQPASRVLPRQQKQNSTAAYYNVSPITTENTSYSHTDNEEQDNCNTDHVRSSH
jgi:hypothetical protein